MWFATLEKEFKQDVKEEKYNIQRCQFQKWLSEGNKLSYQELHDLKDKNYKNDYYM